MRKETVSNLATAALSAVTPRISPNGEKAGHGDRAARDGEALQGRIATRAYELYEQRGRQEGQAVEDWLKAERQLVRASGQ